MNPAILAARRPLQVPVSDGELFDKISILTIKTERLNSHEQRAHAQTELSLLEALAQELRCLSSEQASLMALEAALMDVNQVLWELEDTVRAMERERNFGPLFIDAARRIYSGNDQRAKLKRQINELLGSPLIEQKSHQQH